MRASLSFLSNLRYYFPTFCCFCASCVEWRFQVKISIAVSSNQKKSLSTDFQTSSLVLCSVYYFLTLLYSAFSTLQCICELQSFGNGSVRIGLKATKTLP